MSDSPQSASYDGLPPLPDSWAWVPLERIVVEADTTNPSERPQEKFIYLDINSIDNKALKITAPKALYGKEAPSRARQLVQAGDVVFSTVRTYLKNIALVGEEYDGQIASTGFCVIRPTGHIGGKYIFYLTQTPEFLNPLTELQRGTSYPAVRDSDVLAQKIPLAPLREQQRIVAKIEELFTRLDAGVAELKKVKAQLTHYRQAVLKTAVEGRLTAAWRAAHKDEMEPASVLLERIQKQRRIQWQASRQTQTGPSGGASKDDSWRSKFLEPARCDDRNLPQLPPNWCWASLDQITWDAGYGTSVKCAYEHTGPPVLRIPNIVQGRVDLRDMKFAPSLRDLAGGDPLKYGDILVIRTNGSRDLIGRAAVVMTEFDQPHFFASYLIRFRLIRLDCLPSWINLIWHSWRVREWMVRSAATSAGQYNVNMSKLSRLPLELPPLEEQRIIIAEVERRFSIIDEVERVVESNLKRAERLRQAILQRAFAGRLVPQDSADEPASVLLERIRQEKAQRASGRPSRRKPRSKATQMRLL